MSEASLNPRKRRFSHRHHPRVHPVRKGVAFASLLAGARVFSAAWRPALWASVEELGALTPRARRVNEPKFTFMRSVRWIVCLFYFCFDCRLVLLDRVGKGVGVFLWGGQLLDGFFETYFGKMCIFWYVWLFFLFFI